MIVGKGILDLRSVRAICVSVEMADETGLLVVYLSSISNVRETFAQMPSKVGESRKITVENRVVISGDL